MLRRVVNQTTLLPAAAGFLGGIIVSILVVRVGSMAALLVAAISGVGATVAWWARGAEDRRIQRAMRERVRRRLRRARRSRQNQATTAEFDLETLGAEPEDLVAFHDFNAAQGRFDHWSV